MLWAVVGSCGYRLSGEVTLPSGVDHIQVTVLSNPTSEAGIENIITAQLIAEFTRRNPAALVSRKADADAVLSGTISSIKIWTVSRRGQEIPNERRVELKVSLKLTTTDGKEIWRVRNLSSSEVYSIDQTNALATQRNKLDAISVLAEKIAETIYDRLTENF
jgi:outer membrane lipopolysaccharide assembly protein LptE/RlpB